MRRWTSAAAIALLGLIATAGRADVLTPNPWLTKRVLNIAHQGGENEAPSNTLFALKTAVDKGADVLELDVHATADREIVVLHDATVDRTTNGAGRVDALTLAQIKMLDAAHDFAEGCGTCAGKPLDTYVYRGMALDGGPEPVDGYERNDFRIPTLREVLQTFPHMPINIEIKATAPDTTPYEKGLADLLAEFGRDDDVIVVSFLDHAVEAFKAWAPSVHTATATGETALFYATAAGPAPGAPNPRYVAMQVPITFGGITVLTKDFVDNAHASGLAVHAWTINTRAEMEMLIDMGVDGIMTDSPTLLQTVLEERGVAV